MVGAAREAAGIAGPHHPLPDRRAGPLGRLRPPGRGPLRPRALPLGRRQARAPPRPRAIASRCCPRPRARWSRASRCARRSATGGDWRGLVPPAVARVHRRPPGRACARSSSCCLTASATARTPSTGGARRTRPPTPPASTPSPRAARPACSCRWAPAARRRARSRTGRCWATSRPSSPAARSSRPADAACSRPPARCSPTPALRSTERRDGALWVTGRAGPGDGADAGDLVGACPRADDRRARAGARPLVPRAARASWWSRGGAHDGVTDSDPFFRDRYPMLRPRPLVPGAAATARAAELWSRATLRALARHPVNAARRRRGRPRPRGGHAQVVGPPARGARLPRAPRPRRRADRRVAVPRRAWPATMGLRFVRCPEGADAAAALRDRLGVARTASTGAPRSSSATSRPPTRPATPRTRPTSDARSRPSTGRSTGSASASPTRSSASPATTRRRPRPRSSTRAIRCRSSWPGPACAPTGWSRFGELDCAEGLLGRLTGPT